MFCNQCEQAAKGIGCEKVGVCGKDGEVSALQDLLIYSLFELSSYAYEGKKAGIEDKEIDHFVLEALFSTLTNVNFDPERFIAYINRSYALKERLKDKVKGISPINEFKPAPTLEGLIKQGESVGLKSYPAQNEDILSLKHILLFGVKGVAAYAYHAKVLGKEDNSIYTFIYEALSAIPKADIGLNEMLSLVLKCGEINLKTMEILDEANTGTYGHPVPTKVPLGAKKGKGILVSGHDLKDLEELLKQTENKGIYVYTHGEMLPAHGYPALKKYPHFYGHYGTAWQNQHKEFAQFPGAILMTTNCLQRPLDSYKEQIFTTGTVGWPGVKHIAGYDFSPVIEKALALPGFPEDTNGRSVMVGFARNTVMGVAGTVIEAVKNKNIRHFFLVAGCDGAKPGRNYYTEFVEKVPKDSIVLTLACGKFRFFDKDLGDIGGIPRLLDIGQCNDAYSAIQIAVALSKAFNVGVNELPLSLILSWYEQKAVSILLTLLYLGIKNIRLGPSLPAFVTPNVLDVLVKNFDIKPISTPDEDLKAILG
ncbi:MAG: hydroxylamine reductase [Syntrophorhabdaceae bacterium]|nr:hydroxylamine reductase [Syntrophorhabdaceae bacterium]